MQNRVRIALKLLFRNLWVSFILASLVTPCYAQDTFPSGYNTIEDEGTALTRRKKANFVGAGVSCVDDSTNKETDCTIGGGGSGNSFETIDVPAGTDPVADSSTDTLTITETSFLTVTGTAGTDTIDITQVTTDLGTDGLIAANSVALGTDTTNAYVSDLTAGTYIDVSGGGAETANVTVTVDATEIEAVTFGAGGNASNIWTFNLSGTDPTLTWVSAGATLVGTFTSDALTLGLDENLTIGSDTLTFSSGTSDFELSDDISVTDADPHFKMIDSTVSEDDFEWYADNSQVYLTNTTDNRQYFRANASHDIFLSTLNCSGNSNGGTLTTDVFGAVVCQDDDGGGGSGDINSVGDVASGAAFDGTQGTILTFNDTDGDQTFSYDTTDNDFVLSDDLDVEDATPHVKWTDTNASQDDFESYADLSQWYLTNVTDSVELLRVDSSNSFFSQRNWTWQQMATTTWSDTTAFTLTNLPITFDDADGDQTLSYDSTGNDFIFSDDLEIEDVTPHIGLTDTTGSQDDYEWTADANIVWLANTTDSIHYLRFDADHNMFIPQLSTNGGLRVTGTTGKVESSSAILNRSYAAACSGALSTSMACEEVRVYVPDACTPTRVQLAATTAPTGSAIIIDVNKCSDPSTCQTLFATQANRPQIAASATSGNSTTFDAPQTIAAGSYVGIDVDQVGSTIAGSNLTMTLICQLN